MEREALQKGDVAVFNQDFEWDGTTFSAGTECVIVGDAEADAFQVEILEPKHEVVVVPQAVLDPVQP